MSLLWGASAHSTVRRPMSDMNRSFAGNMPEFYDRFLVPVMFEPFAQDLARRLQGMQSGHVLELAAALVSSRAPWQARCLPRSPSPRRI